MSNTYFRFKKFTVHHDRCAMKVTTDACLFGAWCAEEMEKQERGTENVLDIGAGTGLLSLMVAQKNKAIIDAVEIDAACAAQANENIAASPWPHSIQIHKSDLKTFVPVHFYDVILSNPPFYEREIKSCHTDKNVAHHSEELTLAFLFRFIKTHLLEDGCFYLLLPYKRRNEINHLIKRESLFAWKTIMVFPVASRAPSRLMLKGGRRKPLFHEVKQLVIHNGANSYTPDFTGLLKDYYFYL